MRRQARPLAAATLTLALAVPAASWSLDRSRETQARTILDLAGTALTHHQLDLAAIRYQKALTLVPDWPQPWEGVALVARQRGDLDTALKAYDQAVERSGQDGDAYLTRLRVERASLLVQWGERIHQASLEAMSEHQATDHGKHARAMLMRVIEDFRDSNLGIEHADLEIRAWLTMGDSWSFLEHYPQSVNCYRTAMTRVEKARSQFGTAPWFRTRIEPLLSIIKERLETDHIKLARF
jgi:tetratricopeptide (TPR) repeat protein